MSVMTKDNRFKNVYSPNVERKTTTMCEVLNRVKTGGFRKVRV